MARVANSCCFCFSVSQGFINILYLDIGRIFIGSLNTNPGLLYIILAFTNDYISRAEQGFTILNFMAILIQAFEALRTLNRGIRNNNISYYTYYLLSKIFYVMAHFLLNVVFLIVKCNATGDSKSCNVPNYSLSVFTGIVWWTIEFYFFYIVYSFYTKAKKGEFGSPGTLPSFLQSHDTSTTSRIKKAIVIEGWGLKPRHLANVTEEEISVSIPIESSFAKDNLEFGIKAEMRDLVWTMQGRKKYSLFKLN